MRKAKDCGEEKKKWNEAKQSKANGMSSQAIIFRSIGNDFGEHSFF